jgi:hypothetical protein
VYLQGEGEGIEIGEEDRIYFNESTPSLRLVIDNMQLKRERSTAAAFPVEDWLDRVCKTFKKQKETPDTLEDEKQHLKRLEFRLGQYKLKRRNVLGSKVPGQSLFEAVADQLVDALQYPSEFRKAAATWLLLHAQDFILVTSLDTHHIYIYSLQEEN